MKGKLILILFLMSTLSVITFARPASQAGLACFHAASGCYFGDVNCDGDIGTTDSTLILQHESGSALLSGNNRIRADVTDGIGDSNDDVNSIDANLVLQFRDTWINSFPGCPGIYKKSPVCSSYGDIDLQYGINNLDADYVDAHLRGVRPLTVSEQSRANVYNDGSITNIDYLAILCFIEDPRCTALGGSFTDEFHVCPPVSTIQSPVASSWQRQNFNSQIEYKDGALANNGDLSACEYRILTRPSSGGTWSNPGWSSAGACASLTTGPVSYNPSISVGAAGICNVQSISGITTCRVESMATDSPGSGTDTDSREFLIDFTPPVSTITAPAAGWQNANFVTSVSDSDTGGSGLNSCSYTVVDTSVGFTVLGAARTCNAGTTITVSASGNCQAQGANTCTVFVGSLDNAGNPSSADQRIFSIDYTLPLVSVTHSPATGITTATTVTITATASDAHSGLSLVRINVDNIYVKSCLVPSTSPCVYSSTFLSGSHNYYAVATDVAGNTRFTSTQSFTVSGSCTPGTPTVSVTPSSQSGAAGTGLSYTVTVTNTDSAACGSSTFSFSPTSCPVGFTCTIPASLSIGAGAQGSRSVTVTSSAGASPATYPFTYSSTNSASGLSGSGSANYVIPATCTRANPTVSVTPSSQSAVAGTSLSYTVTVTNNDNAGCTPSPSFSISSTSCPAGWTCTIPAALTLASGASSSRSVTVTSSGSASPATYAFTYTSTNSLSGQQGSGSANYVVLAPCTRGTPTVSVIPSSQSAVAGTGLSYTVQVTNTDSASCGSSSFSFSPTSCPAGFTCTTPASLSIAAGSSGSRSVTVTSPAGATPATYAFTYSSTNTVSGFSSSDPADYVVSTTCGNGVIDLGETCDTAISGSCPASCNDSNECTTDNLVNGGTCTAQCQFTNVADGTSCTGGTCSAGTCVPTPLCGNGVIDPAETCDTALPGSCPSICFDSNECTSDNLLNGGTCQAQCQFSNLPDGTQCTGGICGAGVCIPNPKYVVVYAEYPFVKNRVVSVIPTGGDCTNPKGCPNFVKTMPVEFIIRAEIRDSQGRPERNPSIDPLVLTCNNINCDLSSSFDSITWNPMVFSQQGFLGVEQTGNLECDRYLDLQIFVDSATTSGIGTSRIYLNCIQQLTVEPNTIRVALGEKNIPSFKVSFWNPEDTQKTIALRMESSHPLVIKAGNLRCVASGPNCFYPDAVNDDRVQMSIAPSDSNNVIVDFSDIAASRAGTYEITFIGTGSEYTATANLIVFAEALDDFQLWQLCVLVVLALGILIYVYAKS